MSAARTVGSTNARATVKRFILIDGEPRMLFLKCQQNSGTPMIWVVAVGTRDGWTTSFVTALPIWKNSRLYISSDCLRNLIFRGRIFVVCTRENPSLRKVGHSCLYVGLDEEAISAFSTIPTYGTYLRQVVSGNNLQELCDAGHYLRRGKRQLLLKVS